MTLSAEMEDRANLGYFLEGLAVASGVRDEAERSARLFGAAERMLRAAEAPVYAVYEPNRSLYERVKDDVRLRLGEEGYEAVQAEGQTMTFERAVAYALEHDQISSA